MKKKLSLIAFALLLIAVLFTACKKEKVIILNDNVNKTSLQEIPAEKKTEKETTTILRCPITETTTKGPKCYVGEPDDPEICTDPVSDPTRTSTTAIPEVFSKFLCEPEKIIFCHDGKPQTLTAEMNNEVIKEINAYLREDYKGGGWKYAAEKTMIDEIKSHIHIEIYYDSLQTFSTENPTDERVYNHLLVSLEGQYKNIIFFGKDGKYMSIPIGPLYDDDFSEDILRHIFDE